MKILAIFFLLSFCFYVGTGKNSFKCNNLIGLLNNQEYLDYVKYELENSFVPFANGYDPEKLLNYFLENEEFPSVEEYLNPAYIDIHLRHFDKGAAFITKAGTLDHFGRELLGWPDNTQFVVPNFVFEQIMKEADGNLDSIELALGLPLGWGEGQDLRKIFVPNPRELNLRLPSGSEMGVNEQWLPGGRLPTRHPEAIIDRIPRGKYIETKLTINNKLAASNKLTTKFDPIKLRYHYMFLGQRGPEEFGCVKGHTLNIYDPTQQIYGRKNTWFLLPKQKKNNQPKNSRTVFIEDFNIIKLIDLKKCDRDVFEKEVTALRQIQSPFVARLKHAFLEEKFSVGRLAFEFMTGDLEEFLKLKGQMSEKRARFYAANLVMAIDQLQQRKIVKKRFMLRDFWLGHDGYLLLTSIDIGFADDFEEKSVIEPYTAPELLEKEYKQSPLDFTGVKVSDQAKQFVTELLNLDPKKRLGKYGVKSIKTHAFFGQTFDWQSLNNKMMKAPVIPEFDKPSPHFVRYNSYKSHRKVDSRLQENILKSSKEEIKVQKRHEAKIKFENTDSNV